jgi:type II secretory pathway pseudopilin PulG
MQRRRIGPRGCGCAFALVELATVVAVSVVIAVILALSSGDARRRARLAGSIANLQQFAAGTQAFAADHDDRVWSYSWRAGEMHAGFPVATDDIQAAGFQAIEILRRRTGRTDLQPVTGWLPHVFYSHLVLADYLDWSLPSKVLVSSDDLNRLMWQADPLNYFNLTNRPNYPAADNAGKRVPYSSSYEIGPSFFSPDAQVNTPTGPIPTVAQDPAGHRYYQVGNNRDSAPGSCPKWRSPPRKPWSMRPMASTSARAHCSTLTTRSASRSCSPTGVPRFDRWHPRTWVSIQIYRRTQSRRT